MNAFKERCIALRKRDLTLSEIVKLTGRPKTSVYAHIHDIPLSPRKWDTIRAQQSARIRAFGAARKGKSTRSFRQISAWNANLVFLTSHFLFDGDLRGGSCNYNNRNQALLDRVQEAMKEIYDFEPKYYLNKVTGVKRLSYHNVALRIFFDEKKRLLTEKITSLPKSLRRIFLQSFFDDEGCMDFRPAKNHRQIRGYQKDVRILIIVQKLLQDFQIPSRIQQPNEIVIAGQNNMVRFQKEIDFSVGVRINGKRSNSVWRKSLEKRELLRRAIASYKPVGSNGVHRPSVR
ncbi:MAG: LAGLIDADG family homing endonuclease [Minisyncoccia bacterium]